ncbi:MAG: hypothetical protein GF344_16075, partial [Chitinivibrionales bacterium]|nr:hypothetical protein [Chitinivibrionales bacterium]MBD3358213.1 hypothetical protein [Chitinivibrionales bacterium]
MKNKVSTSIFLCCLMGAALSTRSYGNERDLVDIVVANNIEDELDSKLNRLAEDLRNEGYRARISTMVRGITAQEVWNHLHESYVNDGLQGAILVGQIPTTSGFDFETDTPYWNMKELTYEGHWGRDIWVSRMYAPPGYREAEYLGNALDANHDYRTGKTRVAHKFWAFYNRSGVNREKAQDIADRAAGIWPELEGTSSIEAALW